MNPAGHRAYEGEAFPYADGDTVEFLGAEAVIIRPPQPAPADWYCDICSRPLLTAWGDEPMPIPLAGSYALCPDHQQSVEEGPRTDTEGEPIEGTTNGPWPPAGCHCPPCVYTTQRWAHQILHAYQLTGQIA
jgi:hypothetical protein